MFENFKRMATPRNIQILFAIIGVFIVIAVLKMYKLYEGLENQASVPPVVAPPVVAPPVVAPPVVAPLQITKTTGPSTNNPIIS